MKGLIMNKQATVVITVATIAADLIKAYEQNNRAQSIGAGVAKAIAELFAEASATGRFEQVFGNGKLGKENQPGELRLAVETKTAKMEKGKRDGILKMLKVRLSEARKLNRAGGIPQKGEDIQAALKRYAKEKAPKPEGNSKVFSIPEELGADALADALSLWLAKQTPAKQKAFSADLKDFLPAPTRTRAPAKKAA